MAGASFQPHSVMVLEFQTSDNAHKSHNVILLTFPKHLKTITNTLCWWTAGKRAEATGVVACRSVSRASCSGPTASFPPFY